MNDQYRLIILAAALLALLVLFVLYLLGVYDQFRIKQGLKEVGARAWVMNFSVPVCVVMGWRRIISNLFVRSREAKLDQIMHHIEDLNPQEQSAFDKLIENMLASRDKTDD